MAGPIAEILVEGAEEIQKDLAVQRRAFYKKQRVQMGKALNVYRNEVRARVRANFVRRSGRLSRAIGRRIYDGGGPEIVGQVAMFRRGYYAIHETGGFIKAGKKPYLSFPLGGEKGRDFEGWAKVKAVSIPARPFFAPAAAAKESQVVDIIGDAFGVFDGTGSRI